MIGIPAATAKPLPSFLSPSKPVPKLPRQPRHTLEEERGVPKLANVSHVLDDEEDLIFNTTRHRQMPQGEAEEVQDQPFPSVVGADMADDPLIGDDHEEDDAGVLAAARELQESTRRHIAQQRRR